MKVFGIGLPRTGTQSLTQALIILGIKSSHYPMDARTCYEVVNDRPYSILEVCDGLTDMHAIVRFRGLDFSYPGSKFILTIRPKEAWVNSYFGHFAGIKLENLPEPERSATSKLRIQAWGSVGLDRVKLAASYDHYHHEVSHYFHKRQQDLLKLDILNGQGWPELCQFLNKPVPSVPFPHIK